MGTCPEPDLQGAARLGDHAVVCEFPASMSNSEITTMDVFFKDLWPI